MQSDGFLPSTSNQLAMLRLGSTTTTTFNSDSETRVIFADPCSMCGTKKRRLSPVQDYTFKPRKKISIEPSSTISISQSILSSPITSPDSSIRSESSSLDSLRRCNSASLSLPENNNNFTALATKSPPSLTTSVSFSGVKSPENGFSTKQQAPQTEAYLGHYGSFSGSSGITQRSAEVSPVTASLPPRPPVLRRSVSDPTPSSSKGDDNKILTTSPDQMIGGVRFPATGSDSAEARMGESPDEKRWKRMKERLAEMNTWVNNIIQEQDKEEDDLIIHKAEDKIDNDNNKEVCEIMGEENVRAKRDGDAYRASYKCCCGKRYQLILSILPE